MDEAHYKGSDKNTMKAFEIARQTTHANMMDVTHALFRNARYDAGQGLIKNLAELICTTFPHPQNPTPYKMMKVKGYDITGMRP